VYDGIPYQVKLDNTAENMEKSSIPISTKIYTYGCESWTLRKNEETHLEAFDRGRVWEGIVPPPPKKIFHFKMTCFGAF